MNETDCIFCKIVNKEIPSSIVYENENVLAFLDIFPISAGHMIVIPKRHFENLELLPNEELFEVFKVIKVLAISIRKKLKIGGYNILQNNFNAAGQVIKHFHVHIIPRDENDQKFHLIIPKTQATQEELEEILNTLKA